MAILARMRLKELLVVIATALAASAQSPSAEPSPQPAKTREHVQVVRNIFAKQVFLSCPGSFPSDLNLETCAYTKGQRFADFITSSVTDKAWLGSIFWGGVAQLRKSPDEWGRNWNYYGQRVGVRYAQGGAKGSTQMLLGFILRDDPRNVSLANDPRHRREQMNKAAECGQGDACVPANTGKGAWPRIGHALYDTVTVRRSAQDGDGARIPAISRFAADLASAYGAYPWYPGRENKFDRAGVRALGALGTATAYSFYTEFGPDISKLLGGILKRGRSSSGTGGK